MDITINEIGIVMVIIGLPLLLLSNVMYYKRTQDKGIMSRFWLSRNILSRNEYILNSSKHCLDLNYSSGRQQKTALCDIM